MLAVALTACTEEPVATPKTPNKTVSSVSSSPAPAASPSPTPAPDWTAAKYATIDRNDSAGFVGTFTGKALVDGETLRLQYDKNPFIRYTVAFNLSTGDAETIITRKGDPVDVLDEQFVFTQTSDGKTVRLNMDLLKNNGSIAVKNWYGIGYDK